MLNSETKQKINSLRQILVGRVPNPQSQVDQITNALIYKYMDDMDQQAIALGGKASFFAGDYKKYSWKNLMDTKVGAQERMNIYIEALRKIPTNTNIPAVFRDILKSAYWGDPTAIEVLNLFLHEIDSFNYDDSEDLGDAFEYLLAIMGSQGDAGMFRTPRHIIDFIVEVVNPQKDDTILDPACGTAGFLISAYKHICKAHDGIDNQTGKKTNKETTLTVGERKKIHNNFTGYDISPEMVKLSRVNMFLHRFPEPKIFGYDTLTSIDRWEDDFDVILANPPFMTPKGGMIPHNKFSIKAKKSEVLFVDYIVQHLRPNGRAGIIVPEGIIFKSENAYKELRKMLVEDGLFAVVSLPSGVFNPYAGVKTSILFFDNALAKKAKDILFVKIQNDGFDLGAQRRPRPDLPNDLFGEGGAVDVLKAQKIAIQTGNKNTLANDKSLFSWVVKKKKIAESGDYNLSGERYREVVVNKNQKWPMVELGEVCEIYQPKTITSKEINKENKNGGYKVFGANGVIGYYHSYNHEYPEVLITCRGATCGTANLSDHKCWITGNAMVVNPKNSKVLLKKFLYFIMKNSNLISTISGSAQPQITRQGLSPFKISLPPIEVQQEIVGEIEKYQKIIDGAKQIIENWKPKIDIDPEWEMVELGDNKVVKIIDGDRGKNYPKKMDFTKDGICLFLNTSNVRKGEFDFSKLDFISNKIDKLLSKGKLEKYDVVLTTRGTLGNTAFYNDDVIYKNIRINSGMVILRSNRNKLFSDFLLKILNSELFKKQVDRFLSGSAQPQLPIRALSRIKIPLPPIKIQQQIVEKIEAERKIVDQNKKLIEIFEEKIKEVIEEI